MKYTLSQAATATGKNKATIQRAIKSGKISAIKNSSGAYEIDPSELHRVFHATAQHNISNTLISMMKPLDEAKFTRSRTRA
jgi:predicted site-specific integrase-resolvase